MGQAVRGLQGMCGAGQPYDSKCDPALHTLLLPAMVCAFVGHKQTSWLSKGGTAACGAGCRVIMPRVAQQGQEEL